MKRISMFLAQSLALALLLAAQPAYAQLESGDEPVLSAQLPEQLFDGSSLDAAALEGRVVLIDFWATWCPPCLSALSFYTELEARYGEAGLTVIAVSVDEERGDIAAFLRRNALELPVVWDSSHTVVGAFQPPTMPTSYLIDRSGAIRVVHAGFEEEDRESIEAHIVSLLEEALASNTLGEEAP